MRGQPERPSGRGASFGAGRRLIPVGRCSTTEGMPSAQTIRPLQPPVARRRGRGPRVRRCRGRRARTNHCRLVTERGRRHDHDWLDDGSVHDNDLDVDGDDRLDDVDERDHDGSDHHNGSDQYWSDDDRSDDDRPDDDRPDHDRSDDDRRRPRAAEGSGVSPHRLEEEPRTHDQHRRSGRSSAPRSRRRARRLRDDDHDLWDNDQRHHDHDPDCDDGVLGRDRWKEA